MESYRIELDLTDLAEGTTARSRSTIRYRANTTQTFLDLAADSVQAWMDGERLPDEGFVDERLLAQGSGG